MSAWREMKVTSLNAAEEVCGKTKGGRLRERKLGGGAIEVQQAVIAKRGGPSKDGSRRKY